MFYPTLILEDYIDEKDLATLLQEVSKQNFEAAPNNPNLYSYQVSDQLMNKPILDTINDKLISTLEEYYKQKVFECSGSSIIRYEQGQFIGLHADWAPEDSYVQESNKNKVSISSIVYLNENFIGGELIFCNSRNSTTPASMILGPKKGMVIFFDSLKFHYTNPISNGVKYSYTNFYSLENC